MKENLTFRERIALTDMFRKLGLDCTSHNVRCTGCSFQSVFFQDRAKIINSSSKLKWYVLFGRKHSTIYDSIIKIWKSFLKRWKTAIPLKGLILNLALQNSTPNCFNSQIFDTLSSFHQKNYCHKSSSKLEKIFIVFSYIWNDSKIIFIIKVTFYES